MSHKYAVVTPVKDEENFFPKTVASMLKQETKPEKWIIVNDGSTDRTGEIIRELEKEHSWIVGLHKSPTRERKPGGEFVLNEGIAMLNIDDYDFIVRMDGDLSFDGDYFKKLFEEFDKNPKLGLASGVCFAPNGDELIEEKHPRFHTRGPSKTYRSVCFKQLGGLKSNLGWDTVDEVKLNMLGWQTYSFPELKIVHLRKTQTASGTLNGFKNRGLACYYAGYHPLFLLARAAKLSFSKPYFFAGVATLYGYISGFLKKLPRVDDLKLIAYTQEQQLNRLLGKQTIWR